MELGEEVEDAKDAAEEAIRQKWGAERLNNDFNAELKETRKRAWTAERKQVAAEKKQLAAEARLAREKSKVRIIQMEKKNKSDLLRYHDGQKKEKKNEMAKTKREEELLAEITALKDKNKKLSATVGELREELLGKEEEIEQLKESIEEEIITCPAGNYTPKFRMLIYNLLGWNVPQENMSLSSVIREVLALADKRATNLPTAKTVGRMSNERLPLAQMQIGVSMNAKDVTCF